MLLPCDGPMLWPRPEGGEYVPPVETTSEKLTPAERRQCRLDYWTDFLAVVEERGVPPKRPKPSRRARIGFPIGVKGFLLLTSISLNKRYITVMLACRGSRAKANFALLRDRKALIEEAIGSKLLWQELPQLKSSHITLRRTGVSPANRDEWAEQHAWLADQLETFHDLFSKHCAEIAPTEPEGESRHALRKKFWTGLLERAAEKTDLHSGISPGIYHWIATGAGIRGLSYNYVITKNTAAAELYIDRGKGSKAENPEEPIDYGRV